ncbi:glycosyl hydrolase family 7-domain-containing protein [Mycena rosella]|uniref:cellulose 1,4-beta-cellobiosidase (non-reducing end) n=1 Tax=Mycena rosella TaxID=1033263 RepID=A0AAD7G332_MYCRO|nr:glycosyl hydrolase family 7-domain-containing protein [Mycena rosella]
MDVDGGLSRFPTNKAGAQYGTGYCDSQCPHDLKFISSVMTGYAAQRSAARAPQITRSGYQTRSSPNMVSVLSTGEVPP